jgi:protein TonB
LAIAGVLLVQLGLGLALISGLRVGMIPPPSELVSRLVEVTLPPPPPPIVPKPVQRPKPAPKHAAAAPPPRQANPGGTKGPAKHGKQVTPKIPAPAPSAPPAGGGRGTGASQGNGSGGGNGTGGAGEDDGGTDLEKIAGDFYNSDYPPNLAQAGIGGRVSVTIGVGADGRVTGCRVTRSSGNAQLDSLTCRIIQQRYRFRPSTDRYGRPVADEADVDQDWIPPR